MDRPDRAGPKYDDDFVLWLEHQLGLLRERQCEQLDIDNLLEELEGMVRSEKRELRHRLEVLIMHLLKCEYQPHRKSAGWRSTLCTQRFEIENLFDDSPSLRRLVREYAEKVYPKAVHQAVEQTHLPRSVFPASNPYTESQLLDVDFVP